LSASVVFQGVNFLFAPILNEKDQLMSYDSYNRSERRRERRDASPSVRFYRSLRSFVFFNIAMIVLRVSGSMFFIPWKVSLVWGLILGFQYIKAFGWPGSKGVMSEEWEDWLEDRELSRDKRRREEPEPIMHTRESGKGWREKDLV
jgi:hypothetical protein